MQKGICKLQLNSISSVDNDPSLLKATFSILDFEVSGNRQIVPKDLAIEAAPTLKLKPLMCVYTPTTDYENQNDHFNGHGEFESIDRYGNETIKSNAFAIGVANESGYITKITNANGEEQEVLACDFYLWQFRYSDICSLIMEMYESGMTLFSSCEYYFKNFEVNDGIQIIKSPLLFDGHCVLQSGENNTGFVDPAYSSSKLMSINERWNKAVAQIIKSQNSHKEDIDINNNSKEDEVVIENMFYKALCELSHGDIKTKIMTELMKNMNAEEFQHVWVSSWGVYDTYFIYETYENSKYVNYKVNYTKTDTEVTIDMSSKTLVERDTVWVEVSVMESSVNELNTKIQTLTNDLQSVNEQVNTIKTEKENVEKQFNEASDKLTSLNSQIEQMKPIVETYNAEQIEKSINEKKEYYSVKFKAVNAVDMFESEEVQNLIKKSINESEEGKNAILSLNTMLVDLVNIKTEDTKDIKEFSSKNEKLIPTNQDFDSRYSN